MTSKREHIKVNKYWGGEEWFENNNLYCGKLLTVYKKLWSSKGKFHYHPIKDETFFVIEGELLLHIVTKWNVIKPVVLKKGDSYRIAPSVKHRFTSLTDKCEFIEVSTKHIEEDSIRCSFDGDDPLMKKELE